MAFEGGFRGGDELRGGGGAGYYSYWLEPEGAVLSLPAGCDAFSTTYFFFFFIFSFFKMAFSSFLSFVFGLLV